MYLQQTKKDIRKAEAKQLLLCGTQYGQVYLQAIDDVEEYDVCALLANGSDRSVKLSEQRAIHLYKKVDDIRQKIDMACVAIGGNAGMEIAVSLLRRSVPVLIEHPVSITNCAKLLNAAEKFNVVCHINSHFPYILPIANFIRTCNKLNSVNKPLIVTVACNSRTLYSMLDILMRCFGRIAIDDIKFARIEPSGAYMTVTWLFSEVPCSLIYQSWRYVQDNSRDSPLGHEITVTYPQGVLRLAGTFGPCQWFPLLANGIAYDSPIYESVGNHAQPVTSLHMIEWRKSANIQAIRNLQRADQSAPEADPYQSNKYLLHLSQAWSHLFSQLGTQEIVQDTNRTNLSLATILSAADI